MLLDFISGVELQSGINLNVFTSGCTKHTPRTLDMNVQCNVN